MNPGELSRCTGARNACVAARETRAVACGDGCAGHAAAHGREGAPGCRDGAEACRVMAG